MLDKKFRPIRAIVLIGILVSAIVALLALSAISLTKYRNDLDATLSAKTRSDLERYTNQSVLLFGSVIGGYFQQLDTFALFCGVNGDDTASVMRLLRQSSSEPGYGQMGILTLDGVLYTSKGVTNGGLSGELSDMSSRDYFKHAVNGERSLSSVIYDSHSGNDIIVLSEPIYKAGRVAGVAVLKYDVQLFTDLLSKSQFDGIGATMVMQPDGKLLSGYSGTENYSTFYDALAVMEFRGDDTLDSFRRRMEAGESGFFTYWNHGQPRFMYFMPTGIGDYAMISLVDANSMERVFNLISTRALTLVIRNVFYYGFALVCLWFVFVISHRLVDEYQRDQLTQVYNKVSAQAMIDRFLLRRRPGAIHACMFIDIDDFKYINDSHGHEYGDQILVRLTKILQNLFRNSDIISRFGGDEFLVWMKNIPSQELALKKAGELCRLLHEFDENASLSIGLSCYPEHGRTQRELTKNADMALYAAKRAGKNRCCIYRPEMDGVPDGDAARTPK